MDDTAEDAANSLLRNGLTSDADSSRRIVKEVLRVVLGDGELPVRILPCDITTMDGLVDELSHLVWEVEDVSEDHKPYLVEIIDRAQGLVRVAKRYILSESALTTTPKLMSGDGALNSKIWPRDSHS